MPAAPSSQTELLSQELFLSTLVHDVTRVLLAGSRLSQALQTFLLGVAEIAGVQRIVLLRVPGPRRRKFAVEHALGVPATLLRALRIESRNAVLNDSLNSGLHQWVETPEASDPFRALGCSQYLLMPITVPRRETGGKECIALLWLDTSPPAASLTAQAVSHLAALCQQAGLVLENFRIREELTQAYAAMKKANRQLHLANEALQRAQKRIQADLERAHQLQGGLLPRVIPSHLLRGFASRYLPAGQVGGDYYDCFEALPGRLDIVIADVSGHGISAALVMTMFKVLLKTLAPQNRSPARILERIHRAFMEDLDGRHFVTVFYAIFDPEERVLTYCSAGHIPQFLQDADPESADPRWTELTSHGLVLGMFPELSLNETRLEIGPQARLVMHTDGISEAHGPEGMFGLDRFRELVRSHAAETPEKLGAATMEALNAFRRCDADGKTAILNDANEELADDVTLAILDL